jgi:hypothetical protein
MIGVILARGLASMGELDAYIFPRVLAGLGTSDCKTGLCTRHIPWPHAYCRAPRWADANAPTILALQNTTLPQ